MKHLFLFLLFGFFGLIYAQLPGPRYFGAEPGPFPWGIANGDPDPQGITLWTRMTPPEDQRKLKGTWQIALDKNFSKFATAGTFFTGSDDDWTVSAKVSGLSPDTDYFFRFLNEDGKKSAVGTFHTPKEIPGQLAGRTGKAAMSQLILHKLTKEVSLSLQVEKSQPIRIELVDGEGKVLSTLHSGMAFAGLHNDFTLALTSEVTEKCAVRILGEDFQLEKKIVWL